MDFVKAPSRLPGEYCTWCAGLGERRMCHQTRANPRGYETCFFCNGTGYRPFPEPAKPAPFVSQIDRGLRALDSVKHREDRMTPEQAAHDRKMRDTPPKDWTIADIAAACETSRILSLPRIFTTKD